MNDCFWDGFDAFERGDNIDQNPYAEDTSEYNLWKEGWLAADFDLHENGEDERPW